MIHGNALETTAARRGLLGWAGAEGGPLAKQDKKPVKKDKSGVERKVVATNRRARFDYHILDTVDCGLVLQGSEVKGLRGGQSSIAESFGRVERGEVWLIGMHIPEYFEATYNNHEMRRKRKLLLSKVEIRRLVKGLEAKGATLVPLDLYFNERGYAKVKLALVRGKQDFDKRQDLKKKDDEREMRRLSRRR
jgi:SsrA-binding protein